jgi:hypothetical protein
MTLGDDRSVRATYVQGRLVHSLDEQPTFVGAC